MRPIDAVALENAFFAECERHKCDKWDISAIIAQINDTPTITSPPNIPLTLEELREMDGCAVYCVPLDYWAEVSKSGLMVLSPSFFKKWEDGLAESYGETWLAYRRKPEEGTM